jgi:hypothetical protein
VEDLLRGAMERLYVTPGAPNAPFVVTLELYRGQALVPFDALQTQLKRVRVRSDRAHACSPQIGPAC